MPTSLDATSTTTTPAEVVPAVDAEGPPADRRATRRVALLLTALVVVALRAYVIRRSPFPNAVPDETVYLSMAREIGGQGGWNLGRVQVYAPGYSVLLAPWSALGLTGSGIYRAAFATNAALGGVLFLLLEVLVGRMTRLRTGWTIPVAAIAASLPAVALTSNLAWSDNLAPAAFVAVCLATVRLVERPTAGRGVQAAAIAMGAVLAHGRFTPVLVALVLVIIALGLQHRMRTRDAAIAVATAVALYFVARFLTGLLRDQLYEPGGQVSTGESGVARIQRVWPFVLSAFGQVWYLVVTTAGVAGIGAVALGRDLRARWRKRSRPHLLIDEVGSAPTMAVVAIATFAAIELVVSMAFMTERGRPDTLFYGRYNDPVACILVALGLAALLRAATLRQRLLDFVLVAVPATIAPALLIAEYAQNLERNSYIRSTIQGLTVIDPDPAVRLWFCTAVGLGLLVALLAITSVAVRRRTPSTRRWPTRAVVVVAAGLLVVVGLQRGVDLIGTDAPDDPRHVDYVASLLEPGDVITYPSTPDAYKTGLKPFYVYPFEEPSIRFVRSFRPTSELRATLVMDEADDPGLIASGYRIAWIDPRGKKALWVHPGPRQEAMADQGLLLAPEGLGAIETDGAAIEVPTLRVEDDRLRGSVVVDRTGGTPWPTVGPGGAATGRIRVGIRAYDGDALAYELRADLDDWISPDERRLDVTIDLAVPDDVAVDRVEVQLLDERITWFGNTVRVPVTIDP